jgi:hypothetical protein
MVPLPVPSVEFSVARHDHACVWVLHSGRGHKTEEDLEGSARGDPEDSAYVSKAGCVRYRAVDISVTAEGQRRWNTVP